MVERKDRRERGHLPRLPQEAYQGFGLVHWIHTIDKRKTGWLNNPFHTCFREILTHDAFRYGFAVPVYCLMPDHLHLLCLGNRKSADQKLGMKFFRKHINQELKANSTNDSLKLQRQAFDHVLTEEEREKEAFERVAWYVLCNPARANLVESEERQALANYPFSSCIVPGYPELKIWDDEFWLRFWRIYRSWIREAEANER